jgi:hypothetical protein
MFFFFISVPTFILVVLLHDDLIFDWSLNAHLLQDLKDAVDQMVHVCRKEMADVADAKRVGVSHLAGINHLI